jgi:hypothetical protein
MNEPIQTGQPGGVLFNAFLPRCLSKKWTMMLLASSASGKKYRSGLLTKCEP